MKKNQLALIFLTLITMLAVWYFKSPTAEKDDDPTIIVTNSKNQVLASMREAIRNERKLQISMILLLTKMRQLLVKLPQP